MEDGRFLSHSRQRARACKGREPCRSLPAERWYNRTCLPIPVGTRRGNGVLFGAVPGRSVAGTPTAAARDAGGECVLSLVTALCCPALWASLSFSETLRSPAQPAEVRVAAEWEPVIGVLIGWPLQLLARSGCRPGARGRPLCDGERRLRRGGSYRPVPDAGASTRNVRSTSSAPSTVPVIICHAIGDLAPFSTGTAAGSWTAAFSITRSARSTTGTSSTSPKIAGLDYRPDDRASLAVARCSAARRWSCRLP